MLALEVRQWLQLWRLQSSSQERDGRSAVSAADTVFKLEKVIPVAGVVGGVKRL